MASKYKKTPVYSEAAFDEVQSSADVEKGLSDAAALMPANDASETLVFARQTATVRAQVYQKKYPELKGRSMVPFTPETGMLDNEPLIFRKWTGTTVATLISNYATDFPLVSSSAEEEMTTFFSFGNAYDFTLDEMRKAQKYGNPLPVDKASLARRGHEQEIDKAVAFGVPARRTRGLLNQPNSTTLSLTNGDWDNVATTGAEILADLNEIVTYMGTSTKQVLSVKRLVCTFACYRLLTTKLIDTTSGVNVLQKFKEQNPGITVDHWHHTETAGTGGIPMIVAYDDSPEIMEFAVGREFEVLPAHNKGTTVMYPCISTFAGLIVRHPLGIIYATDQGV